MRALSAQIERGLSKTFLPLGFRVTSLYGASGVAVADVGTLKSADIVVATPEKLDFAIRQDSSVLDDVAIVVLDEGHMIGLGSREVRYEVLVQRLLARADSNARRLVCLSAVFAPGDSFDDFTAWLRSDHPGTAIHSDWRPTRQRTGFIAWSGTSGRLDLLVDGETPYVPRFVREKAPIPPRRNAFPHDDNELVVATALRFVEDGQRVLIYCPQKRSVATMAELSLKLRRQGFMPELLNDLSILRRALLIGTEWLGDDFSALEALRIGIVIHHAGLPRPYLAEIERLLTEYPMPIVIASPTLAQGLNLSCGALIFQSVFRSGREIPLTEFSNVLGRAGRAFVDLDGIAVYCSFGRSKHNARRTAFARLVRDSRSRDMESGLLLLIQKLIGILTEQLNVGNAELVEYVLNVNSSWDTHTDRDENSDSESMEALVADLDIAILGSADTLSCTTEEVADRLDEALQSSLWRRRLARRDKSGRDLQEAILHGRAKWMWTRTNERQRLGYFAAGLGYSTGTYIQSNLDELLAHVCDADEAIASQRVGDLVGPVVAIARILFECYPFVPRPLPPSWEDALSRWISGIELGSAVSEFGSDIVEFIQQGVVYQLVWGVEAIRVHAAAQDHARAEDIRGLTALSLTFGVPFMPCALLLQAGLPSRVMALDLLGFLPSSFVDIPAFETWVEKLITLDPGVALWGQSENRLLWDDFATRWRTRDRAAWSHASLTIPVRWDTDIAASPGTSVRIIRDPSTASWTVVTYDMTRLGLIEDGFIAGLRGQQRARVAADGQHLSVESFAPNVPSIV